MVRLAHAQPALRPHLLPLLKEGAAPKGGEMWVAEGLPKTSFDWWYEDPTTGVMHQLYFGKWLDMRRLVPGKGEAGLKAYNRSLVSAPISETDKARVVSFDVSPVDASDLPQGEGDVPPGAKVFKETKTRVPLYQFRLEPPKMWAAMETAQLGSLGSKKVEGSSPEEAIKNWEAKYKQGLQNPRRLR